MFKITKEQAMLAAQNIEGLQHIDSIIQTAKKDNTETEIIKNLKSISQVIKKHQVGGILGSNVLHRHHELKAGQMIVWD